MALLEVHDLQIHFRTATGVNRAVDGLSFDMDAGEALAIVGESGCGKSVTSMSILRLLPTPPGKIAGRVLFRGENLLENSEAQMRTLRGREIGMIFQEPMTSLNPVFSVGQQIGEAVRLHEKCSREKAGARAVGMLKLVGIPSPERRVNEYPHQLSGGMGQRAMIAMALACNPKLLIADEPTTALDVTIQAQILDLISNLRRKTGSAVLLVTHDLGVVAEFAERVLVMYAGRKVEEAAVRELFNNPLHPYTQGLMGAVPRLGSSMTKAVRNKLDEIPGRVPDLTKPIDGCVFADRCPYAEEVCRRIDPAFEIKAPRHFAACHFAPQQDVAVAEIVKSESATRGHVAGKDNLMQGSPLIEVCDMVKHFPITGGAFGRVVNHVQAVDGVSFEIAMGETLALVGESGCGKSTVAKCLTRLTHLTSGEVRLAGRRIDNLSDRDLMPVRKQLNIIFQDPFSSLNPRMNVEALIAEPLRNHGIVQGKAQRKKRVGDLMERVGLPGGDMSRMPHQFSGGQRQRICIARALASDPDVVVCDEAVSALDVSVQAQIINLLMKLQADLGLTMLFISHDLAVIDHMSDRVAVMYLGRIVESADRSILFAEPRHPYAKAMLSAVPLPDPEARRERIFLKGDVPSPINPPSGCCFRTRCPIATDFCSLERPELRFIRPGQQVACHYVKPEQA